MDRVVLGLGTNAGDRLGFLRAALDQLARELRVVAVSPIYESEAMLLPQAPESWKQDFLNLAVLCEIPQGQLDAPLELLHFVKSIERKLGRNSVGRWSPREIDIDILVWGERSLELQHAEGARLTVPHSGLFERPFALLPLADLWPEWRFGGSQETAAHRASKWRSGEIPFATRRSTKSLAQIVGVLNITPDSFSDGGAFREPERALEHAEALCEQGAEILDFGAESTRPDAMPVEAYLEIERLAPVLELFVAKGSERLRSTTWAVDTRHVETARMAFSCGVTWLNDVSGCKDPALRTWLCEKKAKCVVMHSLSVPARRDLHLKVQRPAHEQVFDWMSKWISEWIGLGGSPEQIVLDPGLGFGKTSEQSWEIVRNLRAFHSLKTPLYVGHSRKSFLAEFRPGLPASERDLESAFLSVDLARKGARFLRVHEVEGTRRALAAFQLSDGVIEYEHLRSRE